MHVIAFICVFAPVDKCDRQIVTHTQVLNSPILVCKCTGNQVARKRENMQFSHRFLTSGQKTEIRDFFRV